jgi:thiamine transport system ATP-binding protein
MAHLRVDDIDLSFGASTVLAGASLSIERGEVVAVLGPSGSGKSTLLRVIAGITVPDAGVVTLGGVDITRMPTHERGVGMVFQDNQLFPHMSVGDNVAFGLKMMGRPSTVRRATASEWLARVGLDGFSAREVGALSGGEAKRVALARTLAVEPAVVLLDEPLTGLDRDLHDRLADDVSALLTDLGITAILVTHDPDEAATIASRSLHMDDINGRHT